MDLDTIGQIVRTVLTAAISIALLYVGIKGKSKALMALSFVFIRGTLWRALSNFTGADEIISVIDNDIFVICVYIVTLKFIIEDVTKSAFVREIERLNTQVRKQAAVIGSFELAIKVLSMNVKNKGNND